MERHDKGPDIEYLTQTLFFFFWVASWSIAKDGARHVPADCWQMQPVAERFVAAGKPSAEPERIPLQFAAGF